MLRNVRPPLDSWSLAVISITFVLFLASLAVQGLGHDVFLEAGVFLVSVKLIMMAYNNGVAAVELDRRLQAMQVALDRIENSLVRSGRGSGHALGGEVGETVGVAAGGDDARVGDAACEQSLDGEAAELAGGA